MSKKPAPRIADLESYLPDWTLIPLHKPFAVSERKGKKRMDGKRPLHLDWTKRRYQSKKTIEKYGGTRNIGVRLRAGQLVIDVDPRNDGYKGLRRLMKKCKTDFADVPRVITGSGGFHYYFTKPDDLAVIDSLGEFPGVEFKSVGRQVVAAGSIHPATGKLYEWDELHPALSQVHRASKVLLEIAKRPPPPKNDAESGALTPDQLVECLEKLDAEEYRDQTKWLNLMMACHHATAGDGREEFIEWSTSDPEYMDDRIVIGRRWDSLSANRPEGMVTARTLYKDMSERGYAHLIPPDHVAEDFPDDIEPESSPDLEFELSSESPNEPSSDGGGIINEEALSTLDKMNITHCAVLNGNKFRVFKHDYDETFKRDYWNSIPKADFETFYGNYVIESTKGNKQITTPIGKAWLTWPRRRTKKAVVFKPLGAPPDYLNLWTGWGVKPIEGDWSWLQRMILEVLCNGEKPRFDYVMNWCANMVQNPESPGMVALCVYGGKGVGKGTLGRALVKLGGNHGIQISSSDHFTGRFNAHLRDVIMLFADEAVKASDRQAESRLKNLITEPNMMFEGKGVDSVFGENYLHVFVASNEKWIIPASADERRYFVMEANTKWQGAKTKWDKLNEQLESGGYEAMLFDLMHHKIPAGWSPLAMPNTPELMEQKLRHMNIVLQFWEKILEDGYLPFPFYNAFDWEQEPIRIFKADVRQAFLDFCRENSFQRGSQGRTMDRFLLDDLAQACPGANHIIVDTVPEDRRGDAEFLKMNPNTDTAQAIEIPSLPDCRAAMENFLSANELFSEEESGKSF